jgi:glutaminyl-tRNA synthetase
MYDFAHPLQDSFEGITHSLCSLEYDNHRVLYDWFIEKCEMEHVPHQYEFGRLNITNTIMSKRYLRALVDAAKVSGYDDPRMPTLCGLRRRGFTPDSIKEFVLSTGLSRINSEIPFNAIDHFLMDDQKLKANRRMAVLNPIKVTITNYPEDKIEYAGSAQVRQAQDIDGTYGSNNPGIRFFTASDVAVEYGGSNFSYLYSDAKLNINVPCLGK